MSLITKKKKFMFLMKCVLLCDTNETAIKLYEC